MAHLPTSLKELKALGWDCLDVILFTGDAYIDHPSFGAAVIARTLEAEGYRVAVVPQPNWRDDLRDFKKLGKPRLFFGVTSGSMDSMVNHYTANKRLRSNDAYTPEGKAGARPDYAVTVYCKILRQLFPETPVVIGGIEASLRRLTHYDYWSDALKPSILVDSNADLLVYGMGERPICEVAQRLANGEAIGEIKDVPQTAYLAHTLTPPANSITLHSFEACKKSKQKYAENFAIIEREANKKSTTKILVEPVLIENGREANHSQFSTELASSAKLIFNSQLAVIVLPPYLVPTEAEMDAAFDLPYTRTPHPRYNGKHIPAYEMIKHSVNIHRGCFGGCSFCTIAAHQGRFIASRSEQSILREIEQISQQPDFKGYLSDVGGPSANMYGMQGRDAHKCASCARNSCIFPALCKNLDTSHRRLLSLYEQIRNMPAIKKAFVGSGIRYDLLLDENGALDKTAAEYLRTLLRHHVSGRLKVAPEHTEPHVLQHMRKPSFALFEKLKELFDAQNRREQLRLQLVPYFISSHPGCTERDMQQLAQKFRHLRLQPEQVQDFTPTPMTHASTVFYTGIDPVTMKKVYVARDAVAKRQQKEWFFKG